MRYRYAFPGLYEQVINEQLTDELQQVPQACKAVTSIDKAEASKVLTQYLIEIVPICLIMVEISRLRLHWPIKL